ncbi:MAG: 5-(carboxyamino)imidazole ribonucleotide synthase [Defluviicoccus sp.]|nr:5-(carboxyamino)imidazole ribonucleotide synthase [Defluviicoccus sp.]MDE0334547.1 5-(carboxyamino)imidazole ribonucleotide synthase [Defluviicoccus sp.]
MADAPPGLAPGSTIGILGGGQLGRMIALAAAALGYRCHVYCPERDAPAAEIAARATSAGYDDTAALDAFAASVDVATLEFENVPARAVERIARAAPVRPGARALAIAQDRIAEKAFLNAVGVATTRFAAIASDGELAREMAAIGAPAILKTARLGYDGKGQLAVEPDSDAGELWRALGGRPAILEARVDFEREISVVLARGLDGATAVFDTVENRHENGILRISRVPARVPGDVDAGARAAALAIARALGYVGVLAVEFFVARDGALLANEIAPRVHNSGHWTLDACAASQFEQAVRAVCGLPLADPARHLDAEMTNLLGAEIEDWATLLAEPGARLHLYGKDEARPGRKMGHVTRLSARRS